MIEKEEVREVQSFGAKETQAFSIKVGGKAFKMLIAGLYSNKIESIMREICTNAWDSHKIAGYPDRKFKVRLPSMLDPSFSVRDFGVSLTHEQVMKMYTTLFESTKDQDNVAVGKFGLGAKTPFAYSDQFTVQCWLNGETRLYNAYIGADGIPCIDLIHTEPSDEEQGVEVGFPVKHEDFKAFRRAAIKVLFAFDVRPDLPDDVVEGIDNIEQDIAYQTQDFRMFDHEVSEGLPRNKVYARQGCVLYPIDPSVTGVSPDIYEILRLFSFAIIEFNIGDVQMTPDRENLSYDPETIANINKKAKIAVEQIKAIAGRWIVGEDAVSRVLCVQEMPRYKRNILNSMSVSLLPKGRGKMFGKIAKVNKGIDGFAEVAAAGVEKMIRSAGDNVRCVEMSFSRLKKTRKSSKSKSVVSYADQESDDLDPSIENSLSTTCKFNDDFQVSTSSVALVREMTRNVEKNLRYRLQEAENESRRKLYDANKTPDWHRNFGSGYSKATFPTFFLVQEQTDKSFRQIAYAVAQLAHRLETKGAIRIISGLKNIQHAREILNAVNFSGEKLQIIDATEEVKKYDLTISGDNVRLLTTINGKTQIMTQAEILKSEKPLMFVTKNNGHTRIFSSQVGMGDIEDVLNYDDGKHLVVLATDRRIEIISGDNKPYMIEDFIIESVKSLGFEKIQFSQVLDYSDDVDFLSDIKDVWLSLDSSQKMIISDKAKEEINLLLNSLDKIRQINAKVRNFIEVCGGRSSSVLREIFGDTYMSNRDSGWGNVGLKELASQEPYSKVFGVKTRLVKAAKTPIAMRFVSEPKALRVWRHTQASTLSSIETCGVFDEVFGGTAGKEIRKMISKEIRETAKTHMKNIGESVRASVKELALDRRRHKKMIDRREKERRAIKRMEDKAIRDAQKAEAKRQREQARLDRIASKPKKKKAEVFGPVTAPELEVA